MKTMKSNKTRAPRGTSAKQCVCISDNTPIEIVVLDCGFFPPVYDLQEYVPYVRRVLQSSSSVLEGLQRCWRYLPSFRIAWFAIGEEYFVAKNEPIYIGKDGQRSREPMVGGFCISEMCFEAVEDRRMKRDISLYIERYAKSRTEILELANQRHDLLIRLLETTHM